MLTELLNSTICSQSKEEQLQISDEGIRIAAAGLELKSFIKQAWHVVEPKTPFVDGWHQDAICEHLQAVSEGQIKKLLINIPPRHCKSLTVSVFFPCWEWIQNPSLRYLYSSYAEQLAKRDSVKCRRLIQSLWYQSRWSGAFQISSDQNEKMRFENDMMGYRVATSVNGMGTGEGGDRIIVDDPHNVLEGESALKRTNVLHWWDESMSTRLNDENTGAKIIIMQRVHQNDLSGHVLKKELGYTHLCLPARYEKKNRIVSVVLDRKRSKKENRDIVWEDRRTEMGEPLWDKFGEKELTEREKGMSQYAIAGQHQQNPSPRGGGMFEVDKFVIKDSFARNLIVQSVRYWDKAGSKAEDKGCYTAGVLMHKLSNGFTVVEDVIRGQWEAPERERRIKQTAQLDGIKVKIYHEQEGGSGGKESAQSTTRNLSGYRVEADHPTGNKEVRAEAYASQVCNGSVILINGKWISDYMDECENFPFSTYKDQVDASSGACNKLYMKKSKAGVWGKRKR